MLPKDEASNQEPSLQEGEDDQTRTIMNQLDGMHIRDAVQGTELYTFFGGRVIEYTTSKGNVLVIKANNALKRSEGEMMHYAATHGVQAPRVYGVYDVVATRHLTRAMVSDRITSMPLEDVWEGLGAVERAAVTNQLRDQLARMRANTQPFIGRVRRRPTRNVYDGPGLSYCGPFADEEAFDNWCLARITGGALARFQWRRFLASERKRRAGERRSGSGSGSGEFVLTHRDFTLGNILIHNEPSRGSSTGSEAAFSPTMLSSSSQR